MLFVVIWKAISVKQKLICENIHVRFSASIHSLIQRFILHLIGWKCSLINMRGALRGKRSQHKEEFSCVFFFVIQFQPSFNVRFNYDQEEIIFG